MYLYQWCEINSIHFNYMPFLNNHAEYIGVGYSGYDSNIDPSISNVFATSGFRQGHSAVDDSLYRYRVNANGEGNDTALDPLPIAKAFFNAFYMYDVANVSNRAIYTRMVWPKWFQLVTSWRIEFCFVLTRQSCIRDIVPNSNQFDHLS